MKALCVFAKPVRPGKVKTRLLPLLTPQETAALHLACVRDTLRMAANAGGSRKWLLVGGNWSSAKRLAAQIPASRRWLTGIQVGRDLGARLEFCFQAFFGEGMKKVVVIGTDTPWMGPERILGAFEALDRTDVVLGPTEDGGYYLVGARRLVPEMFRGIRWGTSQVFAQTIRALKRAGASHAVLPRDYDLDRPADLRRLARQLRETPVRGSALKRWLVEWKNSS